MAAFEFGPGFAWTGAGDLPDAASQALSLALRWKHRDEALTIPKIKKLKAVWARRLQMLPTNDGGRLTALVFKHTLAAWSEHGRDHSRNEQHAAALAAAIKALANDVVGAHQASCNDPAFCWREQHAAQYACFLEQHLEQAQRMELRMSPLKHVLTRYGGLLDGMWLEFGVAGGTTIRLMAGELAMRAAGGADVAGVAGGVVFGFDSFRGLPHYWRPGFKRGEFAREGALPPIFAADVAAHIELVQGWFQATLPVFLQEHAGPVALLHLDCDVHSAALFVLVTLLEHGRIREKTVIVFDELFNYSGFENGEFLALFEVASLCGVEFEWIGVKQRGQMQAALVVTGVQQVLPDDLPAATALSAAMEAASPVAPIYA